MAVLLVVARKYAPADRRLLSATLLWEQPADDESPAEAVRETLTTWYPKNSFGALCLLRTDRIEFAQPGFRADLPTVDEPDGRCVSPVSTRRGSQPGVQSRVGVGSPGP
mgnify:CR=1 FL=1